MILEKLEEAKKSKVCFNLSQRGCQCCRRWIAVIDEAIAELQKPATEFTKKHRKRYTPLREEFCDDFTQVAVRECCLVIQEAFDIIERQAARIEGLETALTEIHKECGEVDINNWPTKQQISQAIANQALKGAPKSGIEES